MLRAFSIVPLRPPGQVERLSTPRRRRAIQDALWRRTSPAEKLAQVARLCRMVDVLSIEGLKGRHPTATDEAIRELRVELRLGRGLAARVFAARPNDSSG